MRAFLDRYTASVVVAALVVLVGTSAAAAVATRRGRVPAVRVLAVTAVLLPVLATLSPGEWPPVLARGDLALGVGEGGLADLPEPGEPLRTSDILLIGNLLLYLPGGLLAALAWRRSLVVLGCLALVPVTVELLQLAFLDRVAATDDVLLNVSGAAVGVALGRLLRRN